MPTTKLKPWQKTHARTYVAEHTRAGAAVVRLARLLAESPEPEIATLAEVVRMMAVRETLERAVEEIEGLAPPE